LTGVITSDGVEDQSDEELNNPIFRVKTSFGIFQND
jgi:hypothetical protein